jgi:hypothetical protein
MQNGIQCACSATAVFSSVLMTFIFLALAPPGAFGQEPVAPAKLSAPSGQRLFLQAHGVGDQIYTCKATDGKYEWTLQAPDAKLLSADGQVIGRHYAGPTWEAADGSLVEGKLAESAAAPDPSAIPWLRLTATRHAGQGRMSETATIQRLNTRGGKPPLDRCDASHPNAETRVPYEADYYFYAKPQ